MIDLNKELLTNLESNAVIITPNQRLAITLMSEHSQLQHTNTWQTPNILSIKNWETRLWQDYIFELPKKLLSSQEESLLWQEIIKRTETENNILNPLKTAELAKQAWHSLIQWNIDFHHADISNHHSQNTQVFYQWAADFQSLCFDKNYIDSSSAMKAIAHNPDFIKKLPQQHFVFYTFLEFTPLQERLLTQLRNQKQLQIIHSTKATSEKNTHKRFELNTEDDEIIAMATWAKGLVQDYNKNQNQKKNSIACVIPNLHQIKNKTERVFKEIFNSASPPVDFSAGKKLAAHPIIQTFLNCLHICISAKDQQHDFELFSMVIRSPYLQQAENEFNLRMKIDKALRGNCNSQLTLQDATKKLKRAQHYIDCHSELNTIFETLVQFQTNTNHFHPEHFAKNILALLTSIGWPGERSLDSTEYQVTQRFIKLLDELHGLLNFAAPQNAKQALLILSQLANNTVFQIEKEKTTIQILGLFEAAGMYFDHVWLMGLDDLTWPSKPKPNPFLPYQLQNNNNMPHASAEREFMFCKQLTTQLISNAGSIIVSSAKTLQDKHLRPSALIDDISLVSECTYLSSEIKQKKYTPAILDKKSDYQAPEVSEREDVKGGTEIIRRQSLCPFMAYASLRLAAEGLEKLTDAPDALLRGSLLHKALELFWLKTTSQEDLLKLSDNELQKLISTAVAQAISEINQFYFSGLMLEIEQSRLIKLLTQTMLLEKQRANFTVKALEQKQKYHFKKFIIQLKVDRIDQLENGDYVVIDYKTGQPTMGQWFGERPKEPQLPLYCILQDNINTLAFVQVRNNNCLYKGISQNPDNFSTQITTIKAFEKVNYPYQASNWGAQKQRWQQTIEQLAEDFSLGKAAVDPLEPSTCNFCDLHSLCRINECER